MENKSGQILEKILEHCERQTDKYFDFLTGLVAQLVKIQHVAAIPLTEPEQKKPLFEAESQKTPIITEPKPVETPVVTKPSMRPDNLSVVKEFHSAVDAIMNDDDDDRLWNMRNERRRALQEASETVPVLQQEEVKTNKYDVEIPLADRYSVLRPREQDEIAAKIWKCAESKVIATLGVKPDDANFSDEVTKEASRLLTLWTEHKFELE